MASTVVYHTLGATVVYGIWSAIFALASLPVVVLSLRGQWLRRTVVMAFIPPVVVGTGAHLVWHHPFALVAAPGSLWLMSPDRRSKIRQVARGRPSQIRRNPLVVQAFRLG